jgi:glycosyltransferase involved in cell wall biosynthesis
MLFSQSGKPLSKMRSIATGVDPTLMHREEAAAQEFRRSLGLSSDDFLIGTACFMRSWKGIGELLAAADFLRQTAHLRWVIIGGGHENAYRKKAEELDLGGIVHFTGHLADPISAIQALNAFTLLSTAHEGVSQAILQAAYLGKPLIATPTGGLCEVCLDGKTGIQVPVFSSNEVAHAVLTLMQSPELCKRFGSAARRLVEQKFTLQHTLDQMEEVYRIVENGIITYT